MLRTRELTDLVRTGVPVKYRSEIWMVFSGSFAEVSMCIGMGMCVGMGMCIGMEMRISIGMCTTGVWNA